MFLIRCDVTWWWICNVCNHSYVGIKFEVRLVGISEIVCTYACSPIWLSDAITTSNSMRCFFGFKSKTLVLSKRSCCDMLWIIFMFIVDIYLCWWPAQCAKQCPVGFVVVLLTDGHVSNCLYSLKLPTFHDLVVL